MHHPRELPRAPGEVQTSEVDDAAAIAASLREPERFAIVFDRHARHIHRYLARQLDRQIADDLLAETFLTAFGKRARYDRARPDARPWLYGIAANLAARHRRDAVRRLRAHSSRPPDQVQASHADDVATDMTAAGLRGTLVAVLADLPDRDRDVLLLIAWEDLTYEEVSTALRIPVGTVRSRLNRARRTTRAALACLDPTMEYRELLEHG